MNRLVKLYSNYAKMNKATVSVAVQGSVRILTLDRPSSKNALNIQMWQELVGAINEARSDPSAGIITIRGNENIFCSGQDLLEYKEAVVSGHVQSYAKLLSTSVRNFADALIDCEKPIVALVQGRAVGVGVTMLPLCDLVYASDKTTLSTPFASLGIVAECCSSHTFPKIMGHAKASALLYNSHMISGRQTQEWGLASEVLGHTEFEEETIKRVSQLAQCSLEPMLVSKKMVRQRERETLHEVNKEETQALEKFLQTQQLMDSVQQFFSRKKNHLN